MDSDWALMDIKADETKRWRKVKKKNPSCIKEAGIAHFVVSYIWYFFIVFQNT